MIDRILSLTVAATLVSAASLAQDQTKAPPPSAEQQAMMEAFAKAATPGEPHKKMASKVGSWTFAGKFWMDPSKPPTENTGTAERTMLLGGRVMAEKVVSPSFMGQTFEGYGLSGYDNVTKEHWGTWSDNMGTGVMMSKGTCDATGNCTYTGEYVDPMTGKTKTSRMTMKDEGPDKEVHVMYDKGPDGKEYKSMELVYTRKK